MRVAILSIVLLNLAIEAECKAGADPKGAAVKGVLMVIAPEDFRDEELFRPKKIFEEKGYKVTVASTVKGKVKGMLGGFAEAQAKIAELNIADFSAVIFVGGSGASVYFDDKNVLELAKKAAEKKLLIGAICIAPSILANAGLLKGKKATSFPSEKGNLRDKGADYTGGKVEVDGNIVTASGPEAAEDFGRKIVELLE
ncbi:MAG: DJ-1/PfpI family protein [Deltaproteobacteria bacterium]|nr:DJ-1/PfpI family protein [Deltaproteobacteria bacterium]